MRLLDDASLYASADACLRFLRTLDGAARPSGPPDRCHVYWRGAFGRKQAFAVKSFLATQDPRAELWVWLDAGLGWDGHEENRFLAPLLPLVRVKRLDPEAEARGTPVEGRSDLWDVNVVERSNVVRFLVLHRHGGTYLDMDVALLRDLRALERVPGAGGELSYQWSSQPVANPAFLRLRAGSATSVALLARCARAGTSRPMKVLRFEGGAELELTVLPSAFLDPIWRHVDGADDFESPPPVSRFPDFFRPFRWGRRPRVRSFRDFFPGALGYHWHNLWRAPERARSYFGLFEREFEGILRERFRVDAAVR